MKKTKKATITIIIVFLVAFIIFYFSIMNKAIVSSTKLTLDSIAKQAINSSVKEITNRNAIYNEMIDIRYKETGDISIIQIKSYEANKICNDIVNTTENNIQKLGEEGISIRAGVFSAIPILSGIGKDLTLHFKQIGAVSCTYHSKFTSAGINQNIHKLYVEINAKIGIVFPFYTEEINVSQEVLLCENIIVGEVPYTYLQSTELDTLLNLVPS